MTITTNQPTDRASSRATDWLTALCSLTALPCPVRLAELLMTALPTIEELAAVTDAELAELEAEGLIGGLPGAELPEDADIADWLAEAADLPFIVNVAELTNSLIGLNDNADWLIDMLTGMGNRQADDDSWLTRQADWLADAVYEFKKAVRESLTDLPGKLYSITTADLPMRARSVASHLMYADLDHAILAEAAAAAEKLAEVSYYAADRLTRLADDWQAEAASQLID